MFYWRIKTSPIGYYVYFKTKNKYIPAMVVDLAIRAGDLHYSFLETVAEVIEVTKEEYFDHEWE
jgi:hypothetical protein